MEMYRRTFAEINLDNLAHNIRVLQKAFPQTFLCPMVKANAYGHGDVQVARFLETLGIEHLGVCLIEEGLLLRNFGVKAEILVFRGFDREGAEKILQYNMTPVVSTWEHIEHLEAVAEEPVGIHLKFDTGMNRLGFRPEEAQKLFDRLWQNKKIRLKALVTHLFNGEDAASEGGHSAECVYLDMTKLDRDFLKTRFPTIFNKCMEYGIDMSVQPIPVVPAAHYLCGGVLTDINGRTDIPGLWAIGETACTGLHGANRLASNSLLECLTTAHNCAQEITNHWDAYEVSKKDPKPWTHPQESNDDEMIVINHMWDEIRRLMWNYMGIVRSNKRLERAQHRLKNILAETKEYYSNMKIHSDILELRNIAIVADLSVECALRRHESRGIHYNIDYPEKSPSPHDTIVVRGLI